jgi:hypothetical protein
VLWVFRVITSPAGDIAGALAWVAFYRAERTIGVAENERKFSRHD